MTRFTIPLVLRGEVFLDHLVDHPTPGGPQFSTPDVRAYLDRLTLRDPAALSDLYDLPFAAVVEFLAELGTRLSLDDNVYLQQSLELSCLTSNLPASVLEQVYRSLPSLFGADHVREVADRVIGIDYLEGWVPTLLEDGSRFTVRAVGARAVHVIAGNLPATAASTIVRSAITRSDSIIKSPSNDPATAAAIAQTMCDLDPDHPLSRHVTVTYWKGGDAEVEDFLYDPARVEKIVAWGGESAMRHIRRHIQPGIDLVALDPKLSTTIIGRRALESEELLLDTASRLAVDIGAFNQEGCVAARVVYVETGTDDQGLDMLRRLGRMVHDAIGNLPSRLSGPTGRMDPVLREELSGLATATDWYEVIQGGADEAVIVLSLQDEPVDFAGLLASRVANLVPIDTLATAIGALNSYTQTVGVHPEDMKEEIQDRLALHGAQRIVTLGHANDIHMATPHDGMEPLRRMCKWVVNLETVRCAMVEGPGASLLSTDR